MRGKQWRQNWLQGFELGKEKKKERRWKGRKVLPAQKRPNFADFYSPWVVSWGTSALFFQPQTGILWIRDFSHLKPGPVLDPCRWWCGWTAIPPSIHFPKRLNQTERRWLTWVWRGIKNGIRLGLCSWSQSGQLQSGQWAKVKSCRFIF